MARACVCCNLQEIRLALDEKIRAGVPFAEIAREYADYKLSPDAVERHAHSHVFRGRHPKTSPTDLLKDIIHQTAELASSCKATGDARGAIEALSKQLTAVTTLIEREQREQERAEQQARQEQSDGAPSLGWLNDCVQRVEQNLAQAKALGDVCPLCRRAFDPPAELAQALHTVN